MKIFKEATVLHEGWEMDNKAWLAYGSQGELHLRTTSHGTEKPMTIEMLDRKIEETQNSLDQLNALRYMVI